MIQLLDENSKDMVFMGRIALKNKCMKGSVYQPANITIGREEIVDGGLSIGNRYS